jgi:chromosomal replication initiation ATPase DnaA
MAKDQTRKLSRSLLQKDKDAMAALTTVTGYTPVDKKFTVTNGLTAENDMATKQDNVAKANAALKNAKDDARASEWTFHNFMLGSKNQVAAQFGDDSNEYQSLGLKKKSEKKAPSSKKAAVKKAP